MPAVKKFVAIFLSSSLYEAIGKLPVRFFQLLFCMVVFDLFFVSRFAGVGAGLRMNHWLVLYFNLSFAYVVASSVISQDGPPSDVASAFERKNVTSDDDEDQMFVTDRQATGSLTCKPEIEAFCEMQGEKCTQDLGFPMCFVPGVCSEPCENSGLCYNGQCVCSVEFTGRRCETKLTCGGLECLNGGACIHDRCVCQSGFVGDRCEIDLHSCDEVVCMNGQCVHGRCECFDDWMGVRCDVRIMPPADSACLPDPCSGDCRCVESCRHSSGYQCVSEGGYIGRNCSIPVPTVSCRSDAMEITISKRFYDEFDRGAKNSYIYISPSLSNPASFNKACRARHTLDDDNYVISISQPWRKCGMEMTPSSEGDLVITNKVWINKDFSFDLYDSPLGVASIQCTYKSKLNVSTSVKPSVQLPRPTVTGVSRYNAEIALCKVSTCPQACPDSYKLTGTAVYTVGQLLHVGIDVTSPLTRSYTAVLQSASISCSPISVAISTAVKLFENSCPTSSGLLLQADNGQPSLSRPRHICLSFRLPRSAQCAQIYIHADLSVCHRGTFETVCEGGMTSTRCSHPFRGKRSSQDFAILRPVVFGPIYLVESGGVTEQLTYLGADQPIAMHEVKLATLSSVKTSSGSFLITAIGSGLLFIIALMVVTLACLKRKGRSKQTL